MLRLRERVDVAVSSKSGFFVHEKSFYRPKKKYDMNIIERYLSLRSYLHR